MTGTAPSQRWLCRRPQLHCVVVLLLLLLPAQPNGAIAADIDFFAAFDQNSDGHIDRTEYDEGVAKVQHALEQPLDEATKQLLLQKQQQGGSASSWFSSIIKMPPPLVDFTAGFWNAFTSGVAMILATEIGDKTFFIAAVLSMRHDRSAVFGGAICALIIMTILSSMMGLVLPSILPKQYTHLLGGVLFLYFGIKLIVESRRMESNKVSEELEEVEEELLHPKKAQEKDEEAGIATNNTNNKKSSNINVNLTWYQVWLQALTLTFLAEWGDRSQIATIALASHKNPYGVTIGGCLGHSICTGLAVIGGRMLAARISEKTVSFWGGCIFLVFGCHSLFLEE